METKQAKAIRTFDIEMNPTQKGFEILVKDGRRPVRRIRAKTEDLARQELSNAGYDLVAYAAGSRIFLQSARGP